MTVSRADLEAVIAELRAQVPDPRAGLHGPDSFVWEIDKEAVLFLGGGRAALLQLAHPFVAQAVHDHSATKTDPLGRFQRTFENVFAMVFGELDTAITSARRVHAVHTRIHGTLGEHVGSWRAGQRYEANDEATLLWVHATLLDTSIQVYELVVRPLSADEKERYYDESKRFARLFGISDAVLPPTWKAFRAYFDAMIGSGAIAVSSSAREISEFLFTPRRRGYGPLMGLVEIVTAGLLPERLRREFGLGFGPARRAVFHASVRALRTAHPMLPAAVRYQPAYFASLRRFADPTLPRASERVTSLMEHVTQGLLTQAPLKDLLPRRR